MADGLFLEQLLGAKLDALALGAGDDLQAQDRIAAQFEEVVGAADLLQLEDVRPYGSELFLDLADRRGVALLDHTGLGQGALVELAVGSQWQTVQQHDLCRHHVVRQARSQLLAQAVDTQVCPACRHAIGHQLQPGLIVIDGQCQYADLRHRSQAQQHPRDLCRLDTIAANLDLIVGPTDELQQALMIAAHAVAAAVDARAVLRERVRHEALGGQRRLADIAQRHAVAADVQLASDLSADRVQHVIQHIGTGPRQRRTDRHAAQSTARVCSALWETWDLWERACSRKRWPSRPVSQACIGLFASKLASTG
ncbi:hypothetical protein ALO92_200001 [Pseudomonas congelans]|uniref:Pyoverdine sidechain peptide synthetase n=1 Tax=Pseudomonas congelans TaxID=200452 RepID=A0A0P9MTA7_9PSED|nr:hypothetical protein ALO92_200001 [Pseudomonas congelans]